MDVMVWVQNLMRIYYTIKAKFYNSDNRREMTWSWAVRTSIIFLDDGLYIRQIAQLAAAESAR